MRDYLTQYYRDPREEEAALATLARFGRAPAGPTPEQETTAFSALARMGRPQEAPAEPTPDPIVDEVRRLSAAGALARANPPPEPPPESEPQPDPAVEEAVRNGAAGALMRARPPEPPPPEVPDPELARTGFASAAGALASTGRAMEPPPPRKPPPIPLAMRDRPIAQRMIEESDRAWADRKPDMDLGADPEALSLTGRRKPDMEFTPEEVDRAYSKPKDPAVERELVRQLDAMERGHKGGDPLPDMKLVEPPIPSRRVDLPELNVVGYKEDAKPSVREVLDRVGNAAGGSDEKPRAETSEPMSLTIEGRKPVWASDGKSKPFPTLEKLTERHGGESPARVGSDDDQPPQVNGWALAAALMAGGDEPGKVIALAEQQKKNWLSRKDHALAEDFKRQQYELNKGNLEARNRESVHRERMAEIELDKLTGKYVDPEKKAEREMRDWQLTDASQRGWDSQDANTAERKADNTRADNAAAETHRHNTAMESQYGAEKPLTPAQKRQQERDDILSSPMPGLAVNDGEASQTAWKASMLTPGERGKVTKYAQGARGALSAMDDMISLREKIGPEMYGDQKAAYDAALLRAIAGYTEIGHSGVLNAGEFDRYKDVIPSTAPGATDLLDVGARLAGKKQDTTLDKLKAVREETRKAFDSGLSVIGARYDDAFGEPPKKEEKTQAAQPETSPDGFVPKPVKIGRVVADAPTDVGELGAPTAVVIPPAYGDFVKKYGAPAPDDDSDEAIRKRWEARRAARGL